VRLLKDVSKVLLDEVCVDRDCGGIRIRAILERRRFHQPGTPPGAKRPSTPPSSATSPGRDPRCSPPRRGMRLMEHHASVRPRWRRGSRWQTWPTTTT